MGKAKKQQSPKVWAFTTYFAEGFPWSIVRLFSTVFFTDIGVKERYLGYINFLGIPWNFKFLWAPFIDLFSTRRKWMVGLQAIITAIISVIALFCWFSPPHGAPSEILTITAVLLVILAFVSATNDIAIDGYYMEAIPDKKEQAAYTGYRVFAWRMAMILVKSGLIALVAYLAAKWGNVGLYKAWAVGFATAAVTMFGLTLYHGFALVDYENPDRENRTPKKIAHDFLQSFCSYLNVTPRAFAFKVGATVLGTLAYSFWGVDALTSFFPNQILIWRLGIPTVAIALFLTGLSKEIFFMLLFIIFYKIGDEVLFSMGTAFLMRELAVTKVHLAWLSGILGAAGSILGTVFGGMWIKKVGLKKAIWPLTLLMNINIWAYVWLAYAKPQATVPNELVTIAIVHFYENFASGLGTAALIVFILTTCKAEFKAAHYAIGSALMAIFSTFFGGFGGEIVESIGYMNMFIFAFALTIPAMLLTFFVKIKNAGDE